MPRGLRIARAWLDQIRATGVEPDPAAIERITADCYRNRPCRDCAAPLGSPHDHGCDVEQCMFTGEQWIACGGTSDWRLCDCEDDSGYDAGGSTIHTCGQARHDCGSQIWDGVWTGYEECVEYGLYSYFDGGWHACGPEHPQAGPALSLLHTGAARWDRERGRWVMEPQHAQCLRERPWR